MGHEFMASSVHRHSVRTVKGATQSSRHSPGPWHLRILSAGLQTSCLHGDGVRQLDGGGEAVQAAGGRNVSGASGRSDHVAFAPDALRCDGNRPSRGVRADVRPGKLPPWLAMARWVSAGHCRPSSRCGADHHARPSAIALSSLKLSDGRRHERGMQQSSVSRLTDSAPTPLGCVGHESRYGPGHCARGWAVGRVGSQETTIECAADVLRQHHRRRRPAPVRATCTSSARCSGIESARPRV